MNSTKILSILLIVAGLTGLAYGKFSYTHETHQAQIGPFELTVNDTQTVDIPIWVGVGAIVAGSVLLIATSKRS